ncbi:MAG: hypothetical protein P1P88_04745, partial [Bacteroidales bacterium]|nr:hypothetical protein [Bacteroidales bacterium]
MVVTGKYNELLKEKAIKEASEIIISLKSGDIKEVYEKTQLSWRKEKSHFLGLIISKPKLNNLY